MQATILLIVLALFLPQVWGGATQWVDVASGFSQRLSEAPGSVLVIDSHEIERMGATSLEEILQEVPGLHVSTTRGFRTVYAVRGIYSQNNSDFLIKINGVPVRDPILGGRPIVFTMPVKNIERIEVVRGPGSLVHGSDAIAGIINVITKTGRDLMVPGRGAGYHFRGYAGSFDTFGGAIQYGGKSYIRGIDYALSLQVETTDGNDRRVKQDSQTVIDRLYGSSASKAPGRVRQDRTQFHFQGEIGFSDRLQLRSGFRAIENAGTGVGSFFALAPNDEITSRMGNLDLEYRVDFLPGIQLHSLVSYQFRYVDFEFHPLPIGSPVFPQGMVQEVRFTDHQAIGRSLLQIESFDRHRIQVGVGAIIDGLSDIKMRQNFVPSGFGSFIPLPRATERREIPGMDDPSRHRRHRIQVFALAQDQWNFLPDWFLTIGGRMDFYSDEETAFSPRFALVHYFSPIWTGKLMYNRSFHMPSFLERGFQVGQFGSEKIDMVELSLEGQDLLGNVFGASTFWYTLDDMIVENVGITRNPGIPGFSGMNLYGLGGEIWLTRHLSDNLALTASYSFQKAWENKTDQVYGMAPNHMVFAEANWAFLPGWNFNARLKWVGERKRAPGDPRKPLDSYTLVSLALQKELLPGTRLTFTVRNLLDADAREPSNSPSALPGDVPLPGRSFLGLVDLSF